MNFAITKKASKRHQSATRLYPLPGIRLIKLSVHLNAGARLGRCDRLEASGLESQLLKHLPMIQNWISLLRRWSVILGDGSQKAGDSLHRGWHRLRSVLIRFGDVRL